MKSKYESQKVSVLKLYNGGTKVADIVVQTGVPRSTVYYWIKNGMPKDVPTLNLRDYHFLKQKCERQEKIIAILRSALHRHRTAARKTYGDRANGER